jgi:hypothetical protein
VSSPGRGNEPRSPSRETPLSPPDTVTPARPELPQQPIPEVDRDIGAQPTTGARLRRRGDFGLELDLGANLRLGGASGFDREDTLGATYGGALWFNWFEHASFGLEVAHTELGSGSDQDGANLADVRFGATTAWIAGRFVPIRTAAVDGFVALRAGVALQHVDADGVRQYGAGLEPPRSFSCDEIGGPGMAFGGGIGARFGLGTRVSLITRADANAHQLSGDSVGECAPGAGSTTSVSLGLGVAYEFGTTEPVRSGARPIRAAHTW